MKLTAEALRQLADGAELLWVFRSGFQMHKHRAIMKKRVNESLLLHVFFNEGAPDATRWSLITNQPLHQWRGYTGGKVWLEPKGTDRTPPVELNA